MHAGAPESRNQIRSVMPASSIPEKYLNADSESHIKVRWSTRELPLECDASSQVAVRVRPLNKRELQQGVRDIALVPEGRYATCNRACAYLFRELVYACTRAVTRSHLW